MLVKRQTGTAPLNEHVDVNPYYYINEGARTGEPLLIGNMPNGLTVEERKKYK